MKAKYKALVTPQTVTVFNENRRMIAHANHRMFKKIVDGVRKSLPITKLEKLFKLQQTVERSFNVEIRNGSSVFYKGKPVHSAVTDKILNAIEKDLPYKPWVKFLNNLMQNPSEFCRQKFFNYVETFGLAIDSNGWVYGVKAVDRNLFSKTSFGPKTKYPIGGRVCVDRSKCGNPETDACGFGLHIGTNRYALEFGNDTGDRFLLLKFNPKDALSCPNDISQEKLRVCDLKVVKELQREEMVPLMDTYMGKLKKNRR